MRLKGGREVTTISIPQTPEEQNILELKKLQNIRLYQIQNTVPKDTFGVTKLTLANNPDGINEVEFPTAFTPKSTSIVIHDSNTTATKTTARVFELWHTSLNLLGKTEAISAVVAVEAEKAIAHLLKLASEFIPKV